MPSVDTTPPPVDKKPPTVKGHSSPAVERPPAVTIPVCPTVETAPTVDAPTPPADTFKYPPHSVPMITSHLDQTRQNKCSTKPKADDAPTSEGADAPTSEGADAFPPMPNGHEHTHFCYSAFMDPTGQIYTIRSSYLHVPTDRNRNYFQCLQDAADPTTDASLHLTGTASTARGEGVLIAGLPG